MTTKEVESHIDRTGFSGYVVIELSSGDFVDGIICLSNPGFVTGAGFVPSEPNPGIFYFLKTDDVLKYQQSVRDGVEFKDGHIHEITADQIIKIMTRQEYNRFK